MAPECESEDEKTYSTDPVTMTIVSFLLVTFPSMVFNKFMVYAFTCACCTSSRYENVEGSWAGLGSYLVHAFSLCVRVLSFLFGAIILATSVHEIGTDHCGDWVLHTWLFGRGAAYILHPIQDTLLHFNLTDTALRCAQGATCCSKFMRYLGLARWRWQREQVMEQLVSLSSAAVTFNPTYNVPTAPGRQEAYDVAVVTL